MSEELSHDEPNISLPENEYHPITEDAENSDVTDQKFSISSDVSINKPESVGHNQHSVSPVEFDNEKVEVFSDYDSSFSSNNDSSSDRDSSSSSSDSESSMSEDESDDLTAHAVNEKNENTDLEKPMKYEQISKKTPEIDSSNEKMAEEHNETPITEKTKSDMKIEDSEENVPEDKQGSISDEDNKATNDTIPPLTPNHQIEDEDYIKQGSFGTDASNASMSFQEPNDAFQPEPAIEIAEEPYNQDSTGEDQGSNLDEENEATNDPNSPSTPNHQIEDEDNIKQGSFKTDSSNVSMSFQEPNDAFQPEPAIATTEEPYNQDLTGEDPIAEASSIEESSDEGEQDVHNPILFEFNDEDELNSPNETNDLHGNVRSMSRSSSSSENESNSSDDGDEANDYVDAQQDPPHQNENAGNSDLAESLKKALEERDRNQQDIGNCYFTFTSLITHFSFFVVNSFFVGSVIEYLSSVAKQD